MIFFFLFFLFFFINIFFRRYAIYLTNCSIYSPTTSPQYHMSILRVSHLVIRCLTASLQR